MRILLADGNQEVRAALRLILSECSEHQITGEARDAIDLISQAARTCPDIIILDASLPGILPGKRSSPSSLVKLIETLRVLCPQLYVIALSSLPEVERECQMARIDAFALKTDPPEVILERVNAFI